ncbi:MAG: hypothetical protein ACRC0Y_05155 [Fusobacteriaceae bacterium]
MKKVFITNCNFKMVLYNMKKIKIETNLQEKLIKIDKKWFDTSELKDMINSKLIFTNPEELSYKIKKIKIKNNSNYIFEVSNLAYHLNEDCENLNSDYTNFNYPENTKPEEKEEITKLVE